MAFKKAERRKAKLRLALCGPSGSGKTYSALKIAAGIGGKIALLDTENGSGSLYSNLCDYDTDEIKPPFTVEKYINSIKEAEAAGYNVLIVDSLTHAWAGQGGLLEEVDKRAARSSSHNSYAAWRDVTPMHNKLVDTILQSNLHIIVTMRSKTAYELEKDERGKVAPVKKGMAPIQRDGLEYEFTVVLDLDNKKHVAEAGKDRTGLFDGKIDVPTEETGKMLREWLETGVDVQPVQQQPASFSQAQQTIAKEKAQERAQTNLITELQLKKLFAMSKESGLTGDDMKGLLHWKYNVQSSKELTKQQASEAIEKLQELWQEFVAEQSKAG